MNFIIRNMQESDIQRFYEGFAAQGWNKPVSLFQKYYTEQQNGSRTVYVAASENHVLGYATLLPKDENGPFKDQNVPVVCDFNVLEQYQRQGVGTAILDQIESDVRQYADKICLGVGLHRGYGPAQRLYIKRGYIPDGSGVWYDDAVLEPYAPCCNNDNLILYLSKDLTAIFCESRRLLFQKITQDDFDAVAKMLRNQEVMYAWEHAFSDEEIHAWISRRMTQYDQLGYDYFLASDKKSGQVVGQIGLLDELIGEEHCIGIGYILNQEYWHCGYATEGAETMLDYAFRILKKDKVVTTIRPENLSSIAVATRIGMTKTGELIKHYNGKDMLHWVFEKFSPMSGEI